MPAVRARARWLRRTRSALKTDVAIVPMDDFIVRDRMLNDSWEHGWDRERLIRQVLDPLRRGNASATSGSSGNQTR